MTPLDCARLRIPNATDDELDCLIWNATCYPFGRPYKWLRQLAAFNYWAEQGLSLCMYCNQPFKHKDNTVFVDATCDSCNDKLANELD